MEKRILDANVLVRYLRADHAQHFSKARDLIVRAEHGELRLVLVSAVLAEVVFVLTSVYRSNRREVANALAPFLAHGAIECSESAALEEAAPRKLLKI